MITKEVTVNNASGLHARPATLVVKEASTYSSNVNIEFKERKANAKSMLGVLSLGINKGATIKIEIDGDDEEQAMDAMIKLIETIED